MSHCVFYGRYTDKDEEYKRIVDDANDHVGDDLRVTHFLPELINNEKIFYSNINQALRVGICNRVENTNLRALVVPNDICDECRNIGGIAGDAVNPVLTTDLSYDSNAIKLYPSKEDLTELFISLVNYTKWRDFIIIYDHGAGECVCRRKDCGGHDGTNTKIPMGITPYQVTDLKDLRDKLRNSRVKNILLFCEFEEIALDVIQMAIDDDLMTDSYHWMLGNINLPLIYGQIDKIRLGRAYVTRLVMDFGGTPGRFTTQKAEPLDEWPYRLRLTYDAVLTVYEAFKLHLARSNNQYPRQTSKCPGSDDSGNEMSTLMEDLKRVNFEGMSGPVNFDQRGNRVNYTINIYMGKGLTVYFHSDLRKQPLGTWTQDIRSWELQNNRKWENGNNRLHMRAFRNADLDFIKISSLVEAPYLVDDSERGFYGFIPEVLRK
ncbi:putative glutamate receptor 1 [Apostichopus japonicus]|uniref:Putative glutamate receptor 1 n=1 Tax=Stichopus japonicus TaxID=307972 RepID=A0A2G8JNL1_STIJA|nr:putative glutamate receptor 1 [Apostichopus japonicus]